MKTQTIYLVLQADGTARIHTKRRSLNIDQVAFPVVINWPDGWSTYAAPMTVTMPEPPTVAVEEG